MKNKKTHRPGALLLAMMMLFTTLPVTARAEAPETEMPGVEENFNAAPETEQTSENAGNENNGGLGISDPIVLPPVGGEAPKLDPSAVKAKVNTGGKDDTSNLLGSAGAVEFNQQ